MICQHCIFFIFYNFLPSLVFQIPFLRFGRLGRFFGSVKAYVQSTLSSSQQTYVQLPYELIPPHAREMKQPCAPLVKSLYGHPLASASWQLHLARSLSDDLQGTEIEHLPSCYWFPGLKLALSVYVDDFTLSGPAESHEKFWGTLREKVQLEDPLIQLKYRRPLAWTML